MVVLVTGARSGFGLLASVTAARRGHTVYAGLRDLETAGPLREASAGLAVTPVQLDVTDAGDREAAVARILEEQGRLDGLVNNAGIAMGGFLETIDEDELRHVFEVNVFGAWALTCAVLPAMRAQRSGRVVMVSSMSGRMANPGLGAYAGSKFALEGLSEAWRHELALFGIRVVLVEPGAYKTDIFERNRRVGRQTYTDDNPYAAWVPRLDALADRLTQRLDRDPQVVADVIVDQLEARRPPLRVPVGGDARLRTWFLRLGSYRLLDHVVQWVLRPR